MSAIYGGLKNIGAALAVLQKLSSDYSALLARVNAAPGLPVTTPTQPYWEDDPPFPGLSDTRSAELPTHADVVVIGSGITAVAVVWALLHELQRAGREPKRVVVCEARRLCSGATGRNGGHIKASPHLAFAKFRKKLGPERAAALVRFQLLHLRTLVELCEAEGIDVAECREVETVDLFFGDEAYKASVRHAQELRKFVPEFDLHVWTAEEARERYGVNEQAKGAISYKAGALWPYRLVTALWQKLVDKFPEALSIETGTGVEGIAWLPESPESPYKMVTGRGAICARHVVHATNGFSGQLIPGLRGKVFGFLGQMSAQRPGVKLPDLGGGRSWSIVYDTGFDYVSQRPSNEDGAGDVMLGGGFACSAKQGLDNTGVYDDSKTDALTVGHLLGIMPAVFGANWGAPSGTFPGGSPYRVWSGVMGAVGDSMPLVGQLDPRLTNRGPRKRWGSILDPFFRNQAVSAQDRPSEWISAAYAGDGMAWAFLCGTALGITIAGTAEDVREARPGMPAGALADWFPADELAPSLERIRGLDITDMADEIM